MQEPKKSWETSQEMERELFDALNARLLEDEDWVMPAGAQVSHLCVTVVETEEKIQTISTIIDPAFPAGPREFAAEADNALNARLLSMLVGRTRVVELVRTLTDATSAIKQGVFLMSTPERLWPEEFKDVPRDRVAGDILRAVETMQEICGEDSPVAVKLGGPAEVADALRRARDGEVEGVTAVPIGGRDPDKPIH